MVDGLGRPLVVLVGPGPRGRPDVHSLMEPLAVAHPGLGQPWTRPDVVRADKGHSSRAIREHCPRRGFACQIPVKEDQKAARRRRGGEGGREHSFGPASYTKRNVIEQAFASYKQWRALATRYDKLAIGYRAGLLIHTILTWPT